MFRTRPTRRRAPSIEALEPRLLFSADPVGATDAVAAAWAASAAPEAIAWQAQPAGDLSAAQADGERSAAPRELALVDIRVPDAARLLAELEGQRDAGRPIDVLVVGEGDDAIAVLDAALSGAGGTYGAVHLFGHGEPGSMQLGAGSLDLATLRMRAGEVADWSHGLTEGADLLLWGCDAGSGPAGAALLDALSALTGADVAASTDTTGGLAAGGNWVLEAARGSIEATVPIGAALRIEFAGSLALAPVTGEVAVATAQDSQEASTNSTAGRQVAASAAGTVLVWVDPDGERILAQRYAADGSVRGGMITVEQVDGDDDDDEAPKMPSVAMDDTGNLLVAWSVDGEARANWISATSLAANVTNFDGTSFKINSGDGDVRTPGQVSVDLSANGQWGVVVWTEVDAGSRDISAQRLAISGSSGATLSGAKIEITETQGLTDDHPDAGIGNDGAIVVVLHGEWSLFNSNSGIYAYRVEAGSSVATPAASTTGLRVSPSLPAYTDAHVSPAFALGDDGRGLAAWIDTRTGSLWTRVIGPSGPVGTAVSIPLESDHEAGRPSVAAVEGGGWVVAWETSVGGTAYGIRAIHVNAGGVADAGGAYHVDLNMSGDQRAPSVAVSGNRVVIAWTGPGGGQSGASALVMRTLTLGGEIAVDAVPTIAVAENAAAATSVTLRASIDGVTQTGITWSLGPDTPAGLVTLDGASGVLTVLAGLDYETLAGGIDLGGGQRAYDFDVTATTTSGLPQSTVSSIRVVLSNVGEFAVDAVPTIAVAENASAATSVTLRASIDGVTETGVTWSLDPGVPAGLVTLDGASGVLTVLAGLDYETLTGGIELGGGQRAYDFNVTATTTSGSPQSRVSSVRVVLSNVSEFAVDAVPTIAVAENAAAATSVTLRASIDGVTETGVTWSLDPGVPAGLVTLDGASGVLTVLAGLDYETLAGGIELGGGQRAYDFDVTATTGGGSPQSTMTSIRVVLSNVHDRAPQLTVPATLTAVEDVVRVLSSGDGLAVSASADAAATRLDLVLSADRGTLTLGTVAGLVFTGGSDGTDDATIRFGGSPADVAAALASLSFRLPADESGSVTITVSVTDAGLVGSEVAGTIALTVTAVNDAPVAGPTTPSPVSLELGASATVGVAALLASDVDDGADRIVYELDAPSSLGDLRLDGIVLAAGATFTQADVALGRVSFAAREAGTATVSLRLADAGGAMAGITTLAIEVKAPVVAQSAVPDVPEPVPAPVEPVAVLAPRAAAAQPSFVATRSNASFSSLSSAAQSDGGDSGSTRNTVTQTSQTTSDAGSTAAASGASASPAVAQPAGVVVRVGTGGTGAVAAVGAPGASAPAASAAAGGVQTGGSALGGVQAVAVVASFAGAAGPSGAGAQLGWHDAGSGPAADGGGVGGMGSVGGPIGGGTGGTWTRALGSQGSKAVLPLDAWSPAVALRQAEFRAELAQARDDAATRFETQRTLVASSVAVSTSLSIGYVVWLARGGVLLTSLLASMPAWRSIDPLPVLARVDARGRDDAEDDDSLRGLLKHAADRRAAQAEAEAEAKQGVAQTVPDPA
jgi:hypothetical protein